MHLVDVEDKDFLSKIELNFGPTVRPLLKKILSEATTIDAVPVVRCKDCKYRIDLAKMCACPMAIGWDALETEDDDFCSRGERRGE